MTIHELLPYLQAAAAAAITAGLFYSAVQFRNLRRSQHVANFTKLVEMQMHLREMRVSDPTLASVYRHDVSHATNEREVREYFFNLMQLSVFEVVWFAHGLGQVPDDYYRSWEARMKFIAAEKSFRVMMASPSMKIMHDQFQQKMQEMVKATSAAE